jgi:hypothetical protein
MARFLRTRWLLTILLGLALGLAALCAPLAYSAALVRLVQPATAAKAQFAPFDLTYLVGVGPQGIVGIRPAAMAKQLPASKLAAAYRAFLEMLLAQCFDCDLTGAETPAFEDVEECICGVSCLITFPSAKERGAVNAGAGTPCILRTTKPFDWNGSVQKWFLKAEKAKWADRDYLRMPWKFLPPGKEPANAGVFVPDDRTVVFGDECQIRDLLDRLKAGKPAPTPPPGWQYFERDLIALAFDTRTVPCAKGEWPADSAEVKQARTLVEGVEVLAAGVTIADRTELRLTALAKNAEAAQRAVEATQQLLASACKRLSAEAKAHEANQAMKLLEEALSKVEIAQDGQQVRIRVVVGCNVLNVLAAALQSEEVAAPVPVAPKAN